MKRIVGIDEAGRGAWAGPLISAAVILKRPIPALNDSKQLTPAKRDELYDQIMDFAEVGVGTASAQQIDEHGLTWAQKHTMQTALDEVNSQDVDSIIIDGSLLYIDDPRAVAVVKADARYQGVMAASIVAKVTRDRYMHGLDTDYPDYQLGSHKGYGTAAHREALRLYGPLKNIHRYSYKPVADGAKRLKV